MIKFSKILLLILVPLFIVAGGYVYALCTIESPKPWTHSLKAPTNEH